MIFLESTIGKCNTSNCVAKVFEIFMSLRYERNIYVNETSPTFFFSRLSLQMDALLTQVKALMVSDCACPMFFSNVFYIW